MVRLLNPFSINPLPNLCTRHYLFSKPNCHIKYELTAGRICGLPSRSSLLHRSIICSSSSNYSGCDVSSFLVQSPQTFLALQIPVRALTSDTIAHCSSSCNYVSSRWCQKVARSLSSGLSTGRISSISTQPLIRLYRSMSFTLFLPVPYTRHTVVYRYCCGIVCVALKNAVGSPGKTVFGNGTAAKECAFFASGVIGVIRCHVIL